MTARKVGVTDVASGAGVADYRMREQVALGCEQYLIPEVDRVLSYRGMVATFRIKFTTGVANQALATLFNQVGSGVLVAVRTFEVIYETSDISTVVRTWGTSQITTAPADGVLATPVPVDTAFTHSASVEFRGVASADGTTVALTAPPTTHGWRAFSQRIPTNVGQKLYPSIPLIPDYELPAYLQEGQGLVVTAIEAPGSTSHYLINCVFEEFTL